MLFKEKEQSYKEEVADLHHKLEDTKLTTKQK
jgi:hypothetical protein